ncbi:MAG: HK97 gp10 family phage protein [Ruminococcus sp.]|nr:HK97 gp10 family phage protein [Ruminococcus sp.]
MAKATMRLGEDFSRMISELGKRTDEIVPKVLEVGGDIVLEKVRDNLTGVLSRESSGELLRSLGKSPARVNRDGNTDIKIGFAENRTDGKSNALLANVLEYGKAGQPPKPFLKPAKKQTQTAAEAAMKSKLEEEIRAIQ